MPGSRHSPAHRASSAGQCSQYSCPRVCTLTHFRSRLGACLHATGGDFFKIIARRIDGSLPIVAGFVTGKGLKVGKLVALLLVAEDGIEPSTLGL